LREAAVAEFVLSVRADDVSWGENGWNLLSLERIIFPEMFNRAYVAPSVLPDSLSLVQWAWVNQSPSVVNQLINMGASIDRPVAATSLPDWTLSRAVKAVEGFSLDRWVQLSDDEKPASLWGQKGSLLSEILIQAAERLQEQGREWERLRARVHAFEISRGLPSAPPSHSASRPRF